MLSVLLTLRVLLSLLLLPAAQLNSPPPSSAPLLVGPWPLLLDTNHAEVLEDLSGRLTLAQVQRPVNAARFGQLPNQPYTMRQPGATYWLRFRAGRLGADQHNWFLELFDSHVTSVTWYRPADGGATDSVVTGAGRPYAARFYKYRSFIFPLHLPPTGEQTYYLKLRSTTRTSLRAILWNEQDLIVHLRNDSSWLGFFYGILGVIVLYNLFLFFFVRERSYLYYVLYVLSCGLFFLTEDGLGFELFWPNHPAFNLLINGFAPVVLLLFFALYSRSFLDTAHQLPRYDPWLKRVAVFSAVVISLDVLLFKSGQSYWVYLLPYGAFCVAGILLFNQNSRPARFYLIANLVVVLSVFFLIARKLGIELLSDSPVAVYSMNIAFVLEVMVLSYALGEKIRRIKSDKLRTQRQLLKQMRKKHEVQELFLEQLRQNQQLKDSLNTELEHQVFTRTKELQEHSLTISQRNRELLEANALLNLQATTIEKLNQELKRDLHETQEARILSKSVNLSEFERIYPNRDACLRYLAELKWSAGFRCRKCGNEKCCDAREPYAQRCTRCGYVESATAYTLLHRCKFDVVKALFSVFLIQTHQGKYSSVELSQTLELRQATCHAFIQKVRTALQHRQQLPAYDRTESWTEVLFVDEPPYESESADGDGSAAVDRYA